MSIAAIVTEGFGSFGSIGLVVTSGYLAGVAPPPVIGDTHDGFRKRDVDHKKLNKILAKREQKKLEGQQELRRELDRQFYGEEPEADEAKALFPKANAPILEDKIGQLSKEIAYIQQQIQFHQEAMRMEAEQERRAKDEHEVNLIMMLLDKRTHEMLNKFLLH